MDVVIQMIGNQETQADPVSKAKGRARASRDFKMERAYGLVLTSSTTGADLGNRQRSGPRCQSERSFGS